MTVVILTGMPGAGKSTVSRLLAARLPRAVRLSADDVQAMIVSGAVWPLGQPEDEAARQVDLVHRNLAALAENCSGAGFVVLVDCVLPDAAHLERFLGHFTSGPPDLVVLAPSAGVCRERNATRDERERFDFGGYDELEASMRRGFGDRGLWLDTGGRSAEATVALIARELDLELGSDARR